MTWEYKKKSLFWTRQVEWTTEVIQIWQRENYFAPNKKY